MDFSLSSFVIVCAISAFAKLCHDETPMVRRSAASNLKNVVKELSKKDALKDGVALFNDLAADEHVSFLSLFSFLSLLFSMRFFDLSSSFFPL